MGGGTREASATTPRLSHLDGSETPRIQFVNWSVEAPTSGNCTFFNME